MQPEPNCDLAGLLARNRLDGTASALPFTGIATRAEAYAVQMAALDAYGSDLRGYALAGTNPACLGVLGLTGPIFGPIPRRDLGNSNDRRRLPQGLIGAQCQLLFTIGGSYPDRNEHVDRETAAEAIIACRPSIGLVGRRTLGVPHHDLVAIADFGLHVATICGPAMRGDWLELDRLAMTARIDGKTVLSGSAAAILGHPLDAVAWLARELARQGRQINAGEIVATGSCVPVLQVLPGQTLSVEFDRIGAVSCAFD
jgi:2-keto-4-pentenoate hydratase